MAIDSPSEELTKSTSSRFHPYTQRMQTKWYQNRHILKRLHCENFLLLLMFTEVALTGYFDLFGYFYLLYFGYF